MGRRGSEPSSKFSFASSVAKLMRLWEMPRLCASWTARSLAGEAHCDKGFSRNPGNLILADFLSQKGFDEALIRHTLFVGHDFDFILRICDMKARNA